MAKFNNFDDYITNAESFAQPILNYFRSCVQEACPEAEESFKWSMPFFVYKGNNLCHMAAFKQHTSFSFWLAGKMKDQHKLFVTTANSGMGQFGKVSTLDQLPRQDILIAYIVEAMALADAGEKLESAPKKPARKYEAPEMMVEALAENTKAMAMYNVFSQSNKNDYIEWIIGAKTDATRDKRIAQMLEWLEEGKPRNWKYMKEYKKQINTLAPQITHVMTPFRYFLVAFALSLSYFSFAQTRIGYTSSDVLIKNHPQYESAQEDYKKKEKELSVKAAALMAQLQEAINKYTQKKEAGGNTKELHQLEQEVLQKQEACEMSLQELDDQLAQYQAELFDPILKEIDDALFECAKENNIDAIYQSANDEGVSFILYAPDNNQITHNVLTDIKSTADLSEIEPFDMSKNKVRIGYTNIEVVVAMMPESDRMNEAMEFYKSQLISDFEVKRKAGMTIYELYQAEKDPVKRKSYEEQLLEIQSELETMESEFQGNLDVKRNTLMEPILEKAQAAIEKVAKKNKLTYVLNQTNSSGVSTIVYGPDNADITVTLYEELGVDYSGDLSSEISSETNVKVGYINVERALAMMPESSGINEKIDAKTNELYQEAVNSGKDPNNDSEVAQEIMYKVNQYKSQLLNPLMIKLQDAIDKIAVEGGFDYVINQTSSNVLYAQDAFVLSDELFEALGL